MAQAQGLAVSLRKFPRELSERLNVSFADCEALFLCVGPGRITRPRAFWGPLRPVLKPDNRFPT